MARPKAKPVKSDRFWDRKLVPSGHTRVLSVGMIFPKEWSIVRVTEIGRADDSVVLRFNRLV